MKTIEWAAGLFEGEGTITKNRSNSYYLQLSMVDKDVVEMFLETLGVGKFYELKAVTITGKTIYRASIHKIKDVRAVLTKFLPHLGNRRAHKALDCLDILDYKDNKFLN